MKDENLLIGALGSTITDLVIDYVLSKVGAWYAVQFFDSSDRKIWGYGSGDAVVDGVGATLLLAGHFTKDIAYKEIGIAWLLTHGMIKLSELYNYIRNISGIEYSSPPYKVTLKTPQQTLKFTRFRKRRFWTLKVKH